MEATQIPASPVAGNAFGEVLEAYLSARDAMHALPVNADFELDGPDSPASTAFARASEAILTAQPETLADLCDQAAILRDIGGARLTDEFILALRRLAGNPEPRSFKAAEWLDRWERAGGEWVQTGGVIELIHPVGEDQRFLAEELVIAGGIGKVKALIAARSDGANPADLPCAVGGGLENTPWDNRDVRDKSPCAVSAISADSPAMTPPFERALEAFIAAQVALHTMPDDVSPDREKLVEAAFFQTRDAFLELPAQSLAEWLEQAGVLWRDDPGGCLPARDVARLLARLRVLAGNPVPQSFDQIYWLGRWERNGGQWIVRGDAVTLLTPTGSERHAELLDELSIAGGRRLVEAEIADRHRGLAGEAEQ